MVWPTLLGGKHDSNAAQDAVLPDAWAEVAAAAGAGSAWGKAVAVAADAGSAWGKVAAVAAAVAGEVTLHPAPLHCIAVVALHRQGKFMSLAKC